MVRLVLLCALALIVAFGVLLLSRPDVVIRSRVDPEVAVECTAATGVGEAACGAWGDAILADGSPSSTFEAGDLVRMRLDRTFLGFGATCRAEWFLGRYPADVAWAADVTCADP